MKGHWALGIGREITFNSKLQTPHSSYHVRLIAY